jgi:hypothetical protein
LEPQDFEARWADGAALTTDEAIANVQRGCGECERPTTGRESRTAPSDSVKLVLEIGQQRHRHRRLLSSDQPRRAR